MEKVIPSYKSCYYNSVWQIIEWKNDCIFKTKFIGYISNEDKNKYPVNDFVLSSISTKLIKNEFCILKPYLSKREVVT